MGEQLKKLARYLYVYGIYGLYIYAEIYWLKKKTIKLRAYGAFFLRPKTLDAEIFTQMFIYKQYNSTVNGTVKVVFDLGGNNGMSAIFFAHKYPEAIIYVLEPDKENFKVLLRNIKDWKNIIALNKAIWKEDGLVNLDAGDSWAIRVDMEAGVNVAEATKMQTLISQYNIKQIDILKIDIEGAEKELFEGDISFLSKTKNIMIELHDWMRPDCAAPFFRALNNYSYAYAVNHENTLISDLKETLAV